MFHSRHPEEFGSKRCPRCGKPIRSTSLSARRGAEFCSHLCRIRHWGAGGASAVRAALDSTLKAASRVLSNQWVSTRPYSRLLRRACSFAIKTAAALAKWIANLVYKLYFAVYPAIELSAAAGKGLLLRVVKAGLALISALGSASINAARTAVSVVSGVLFLFSALSALAVVMAVATARYVLRTARSARLAFKRTVLNSIRGALSAMLALSALVKRAAAYGYKSSTRLARAASIGTYRALAYSLLRLRHFGAALAKAFISITRITAHHAWRLAIAISAWSLVALSYTLKKGRLYGKVAFAWARAASAVAAAYGWRAATTVSLKSFMALGYLLVFGLRFGDRVFTLLFKASSVAATYAWRLTRTLCTSTCRASVIVFNKSRLYGAAALARARAASAVAAAYGWRAATTASLKSFMALGYLLVFGLRFGERVFTLLFKASSVAATYAWRLTRTLWTSTCRASVIVFNKSRLYGAAALTEIRELAQTTATYAWRLTRTLWTSTYRASAIVFNKLRLFGSIALTEILKATGIAFVALRSALKAAAVWSLVTVQYGLHLALWVLRPTIKTLLRLAAGAWSLLVAVAAGLVRAVAVVIYEIGLGATLAVQALPILVARLRGVPVLTAVAYGTVAIAAMHIYVTKPVEIETITERFSSFQRSAEKESARLIRLARISLDRRSPFPKSTQTRKTKPQRHAPVIKPPTAAPVEVKTVSLEKTPARGTPPAVIVRPKKPAIKEIIRKDESFTKKKPDRALPLLPDITRGSVASYDISITFDGGYEAGDALVILMALRARGIKTTIFLTGTFIEKYPELVRQMVFDGHEIGNHTYDHAHLTTFEKDRRHRTLPGVTSEFIAEQLRVAEEAYTRVTGKKMAPLWRAPYGEINRQIRRWAFEEGYIHVGWTSDYKRRESLDTLDWVHDTSSRLYRTSSEIKNRVMNFGKSSFGLRGGIILMHLGSSRKVDRPSLMLDDILDGLIARGYRFVKVSKLINDDARLQDILRQHRQLALNKSF